MAVDHRTELAARVKAAADRVASLERKAAAPVAGLPGPVPQHEWIGTKLRFEQSDGTWGESVDLQGPQGKAGRDGRIGGGGFNPMALEPASNATPDALMIEQGGRLVRVPWAAFVALVGGSTPAQTSNYADDYATDYA